MLLKRSLSLAALLVLAASALVVPTAVSASTPGPVGVDTVFFDSNRTGNYEVFKMNSDGSGVSQLTSDATWDSFWPKIAPARTTILFVRTPKGQHDTNFNSASLWLVDVDGTNLRQLLGPNPYGWTFQGHPEWSPDGKHIVESAGLPNNVTDPVIIDSDGKNPVVLVRGADGQPRGGNNTDPSWSPDGKRILFIGCPPISAGSIQPGPQPCVNQTEEVYRVNVDGTEMTRMTNDVVPYPDNDPYYSPDMSRIAWLRNTGSEVQWGIELMNADGSGQHAVIDDGSINSKPSWTLDSNWIYFHRAPLGQGWGFNIWRIHPDGTGLNEVLPNPGRTFDNEYPNTITVPVPDVTAPTVSITNGPPAVAPFGAAAFWFVASDPDDATSALTTTCTLSGPSAKPAAPCTSPTGYWGLSPGSYTFSVFATDRAGNAGAPATWSWTVSPSH